MQQKTLKSSYVIAMIMAKRRSHYNLFMVDLIITSLATALLGGVWFFFVLHAVQRISDAADRTKWFLYLFGFNFFAIPFYVYFKYIPFCREGKAGILRVK